MSEKSILGAGAPSDDDEEEKDDADDADAAEPIEF